jgi:hypothetical protein
MNLIGILSIPLFSAAVGDNARWNTGDNRVGGHVMGDHGAGSHHSAGSNLDSAHNYRRASNRSPTPYHGGFKRPIAFDLRRTVAVGRAGTAIVDENHPVTNEHFILDSDSGTDEGVTGDLAAPADMHSPLNLDERANPSVIADRAPVQVDEPAQPNSLAERHVGGDADMWW